jgi:hypothetical protein
MIASTNELAKEFVNKKLLIFKRFQENVKEIKCLLQWWEKHETMFPTMGFLACQKLGIVVHK